MLAGRLELSGEAREICKVRGSAGYGGRVTHRDGWQGRKEGGECRV